MRAPGSVDGGDQVDVADALAPPSRRCPLRRSGRPRPGLAARRQPAQRGAAPVRAACVRARRAAPHARAPGGRSPRVFAPSPASVRRRCSAAATRSSSTVVMPSSCQILRTVFGPRPGMRRNAISSGGTRSRRVLSASISPSWTIWTIFSSIVLPIPGELARLALERHLRDRARRLADPCARAAVREHAERLDSLDLEQVGEQLEALGHVGVLRQRRRHSVTIIWRGGGRLPADLQRARESRADGARARRGAAGRRPRARDRRRLARRHRRGRRPPRRGARLRRRAPSAAKGGARTRVPRRLPQGARGRRRPRARDGLRLLARPCGRAATGRGGLDGGPRAGLPLRRRRRIDNWRLWRRASLPAGRSTRA